MSEPKFTPGPYRVEPLQYDQGASIAICSTGDDAHILATIAPENAEDEPDMDTAVRAPEDVYNAGLFAAAPSLYTAIEDLLSAAKENGFDTWPGDSGTEFRNACERAQDALALVESGAKVMQ